MQAVGQVLRRSGVAVIYLVHGTFIGRDGLGLLNCLARVAPELAETLGKWNKQLLDSIARDHGNFTEHYAQLLEDSLADPGASPLPVRRFIWSGENHHLGRADGAVRLLAELMSRKWQPGDRALFLAHSHGGNVLALLTNLLASPPEHREAFFQAARAYYRWPLLGRLDFPIWDEVHQVLTQEGSPWPHLALDLATLGTPVRYGWDLAGCARLMHFIFHRPVAGLPEYQAQFPPSADDLWSAAHGDFVQYFGIAGTNFPPPVWSWRTCDADVRLGRLLQPKESLGDLLSRLRLGVRAHADGDNLLVDYGTMAGTPANHILGHAVYTRESWMLYHLEQISKRWYSSVA